MSKYNLVTDILTELYGSPKWELEKKEGQSKIKVMNEWDKALSGYADDQLQNACYRIFKFKKSSSYPSLSHLLSELVDEKPEDKNNEITREKTEIEIWYEKNVVSRTKNEMPMDYLYPVYNHACNELIKSAVDFTQGYCNSFAEGLKLAYSNGYLDNFEVATHNYAKSQGISKISDMALSGNFNVKKAVRNIFR